jgi:hypothetical protein
MKLQETLEMRQKWALEEMNDVIGSVLRDGWSRDTMAKLRLVNDSINVIIAAQHLIECGTE